MSHTSLPPQRERWLLLTLAGIQFTYILDFMVMMPLGPQFTRLFAISDAQFGALVSAYTFSAGASGLAASAYLDRFDRKRLLLVLYTFSRYRPWVAHWQGLIASSSPPASVRACLAGYCRH